MPLSWLCAILGGMKILASVVALVLVGLTGAWLWMDATAQARQEPAGVVITGPVDPDAVTAVIGGQDTTEDSAPTGDSTGSATATEGPGRSASLDQVVTLLGSTSEALLTRAAEAREAEEDAKAAEEERKAAEKAAEEQRRAAEKAAEEQRKAAEKAAEEQRRAEPIPVQPAPVAPGGGCEWDEDDAEWDCDDDDDDDR
ncbi:hypothetical protein [Ornithinimicrobium pekingense]|uniref:Uncharacterized protein n=1 Tax=Ornithinimicrobium pekingense TaxID=384677 RepID=A0ABQ2FAV6_9MICO|nr:hypothetical protein [Ornithinimicrobium pekingense]GGK78812.1 hypothetical protein GCM10011509_29160 [Ornithinimicrobium pekingense]